MAKRSSEIIQDVFNKLVVDERAYNVCLSKHIENNELVPYYISFSFWYGLYLVSCKLYLNDNNKTFRVLSGNFVVFEKINFDDLFEELAKYDYELNSSKAAYGSSRTYDDRYNGLYIVGMTKIRKNKK